MPRSVKKPPPVAETKAKATKKPAGVAAVSKSVVATQGFEEVILTCKKKVEKIAKECRAANRKYRDIHFDLKWDGRYCLDGLTDEYPHLNPAGTLRVEEVFEDPKFYKDGISAGDIEQGATGDCWFMAAVATIGNIQGLLEKICVAQDEAVGVYGFIFMRDGEWISTIIDDQLYTTKPEYQDSDEITKYGYHRTEKEYTRDFMRGSKALHFGKCHDPDETWLPLLEKAYAKAHGDYGAIEGGCPGEAVEDLTGGVTTEFLTSDLLDRNRFWKDEFLLVNKDFLFAASISGTENRSGILAGHSYSVLKTQEVKGEKFVLVRNPWGHSEWTGAWSDGSKEWTAEWMTLLSHRFGDDGAFWMSYNDFLHKFGHIEQTRLFDTTWTLTTRWVKIPVPWVVEYSATRFEVTVAHKGPVVFVLSQLDNRYFKGLQGQYKFELHFRVHRDDEVDYIAHSRSNVGMSRSVSTELELEPGKYKIIFKITAEKQAGAKTMEQVTKETSKVDRKKFLQIARSYDLAHDSISVQPEDESEIEAAEVSRAAKPAVVASKAAKKSSKGKGSGKGKWKEGSDNEDTGSESGSSSSSSDSSSSSSSSSSSGSSSSGSSSGSSDSEASSSSVSETSKSVTGDEDDIWDAIACVGLRVYSQNKDLTVAVVHVRGDDAARDAEEDKGGEGDDEKEEKGGKKSKKQGKKKEKKKEDEGEDDDEKKDKKDGGKGEKDKKDKKKDKKKGEEEEDKKDKKKKDKKKGEEEDKNENDEKVKDKKEKKDKKEEGGKDEKDKKEEGGKDEKDKKEEGGKDEKKDKKEEGGKDKKKEKGGEGDKVLGVEKDDTKTEKEEISKAE